VTVGRARALDAADPLASRRALFAGIDDGGSGDSGGSGNLVYLDGNSLGRPLRASIERVTRFLTEEWAGRLIRGWDERWMELPLRIGDDLGAAALGAAPGQVAIGDSTSVLLYKLARAAVAARPGRDEIVADAGDFPTDRYVLAGIARELGLTMRWVETDPDAGLTPEAVQSMLGDRTAVVVASAVSYRSGFLADVPAITARAHEAGALTLWDLCHSVGAVPTELDAWGVDLAVGCTYKYLNGGPGSPAFAYVRSGLQHELTQPIQGWMGGADIFEMGPAYAPATGIRRMLSGTPAITSMLAMQDMIALIAEVGMPAIRDKSVALTEYAIEEIDDRLGPLGVRVATPREPDRRGSHVTISHPGFRGLVAGLWERDVLPDFRAPDGLRIGLSPLSTSFEETHRGIAAIADALRKADR
jgi:kynureninase